MTPAPDTSARGDAGPRVSAEQLQKVATWNEDLLPTEFAQKMALDLLETREIVARVNNCFGSYTFHTNPHPAEIIEDLKHEHWVQWGRARDAEARITDLERRLADAERGGWRPIASAPKDGTRIWVLSPKHNQVAAWWSDVDGGGHPENGPSVFWWVSEHVEFIDGSDDAPTHWMPLPPMPHAAIPALQEGKPE